MISISSLRRLLLLGAFAPLALSAQVPAESEDVMLQGFYWNSQQQTSWPQLTAQASDIARSFTLIWLPPSASPEGGGVPGGTNVGYHPRQWNDQTSCWGTAADLKTLIRTLHGDGVKVVADIVINHRAGDTGWGNFTADDFGSYGSYQLTGANICSDDEMNTDPAAGDWRGKATGAKDTGENWGGARDLDHTSPYVQADCKAYLAWLKGEMGYDGFRYDFVKGYGGSYVGMYNEATKPYLSVGEYWDGSYDKVAAWIEATGRRSMAFDFPMKYAALNEGLAKSDYSKMAWAEDGGTLRPAGMIHHHNYRGLAVTFVDNHDTYRDDNKYKGYVEQAYAFILSSAGVPCVFWPHWQSNAREHIEQMIAVRRTAGIHSESDVTVTASTDYYESLSVGHRGRLITRIGFAAPRTVPNGYYLAASGSNWWMYLSDNLAGISSPTATNDLQVSTAGSELTVSAAGAYPVSVYRADGVSVTAPRIAPFTLSLPHGTYVVKAGSAVKKVGV